MIYKVPSLQVRHFVPRRDILARLEELFGTSTPSSRSTVGVLLGMGGAGKTQLGLEWCRRMKESGKFRAIFWLDASSLQALYQEMEIIAKLLSPGRQFDDPEASVTFVRDILSGWSDRWLMVFDNLDNPSDLQDIDDFFPDSCHGSILVTSRYAGTKRLGQAIELDQMVEKEALQLLLGPSGLRTDDTAAKEVLRRLGYLPLAIDQAGAYILKRGLRPKEFLDEFERRKYGIMKETPSYWHYRSTLPDQDKAPLSLLTTWEMSLSLLRMDEEHTATLEDVLTLFAFFHPVSISEKVFSSSLVVTPSAMSIFHVNSNWDHMKFEEAIVRMQQLSLLQFSRLNESEIAVSLHTMVSEWLRIRQQASSRCTFLATAIFHLANYLDSTERNDYATRQEALSHTDTICGFSEFRTENNDFLGACHSFGGLYHEGGRWEDAERMYNRALAGYEKALGLEHTSTLETVNNLGLLYNDLGRFEDAERMYTRALAGYEKALGLEHTSTLDTVSNLGSLYNDLGRFEDAERMYNQALAGYEKALGPEHTSTLNAVDNLGSLYNNLGRFEDAERMYNRALAGREKALGLEHTSTLAAVNNLGSLYYNLGHFEDAERMYNRALAGCEKAYGLEHSSTLGIVNNLGLLYNDLGRFEDAERMYNRALAGKEKALGLEHTSTLNTVNNLGILYKNLGHFEDAERMYNRALAGYEKALGLEHTSTLNAVDNLGNLYSNLGRFEDAERMYNRALAGCEKALGLEHASTLNNVNNLGLLYYVLGRFEDAERMYNRALAGYENALGLEHTSTLNTVNNLGSLYNDLGRFEDAERMYTRALAGFEKALGPEHTSTLHTVHSLLLLYTKLGRLEDAGRMSNWALARK
jgi:tetratricopeptide (TPR) repeat protein